MSKDNTLTVALVAAGCFIIACVTGLTAVGRDATQVMYLVGTTLPGTIAALAALRASNKAKNSADTAAVSAENAADTALNAAEHAANSAAAQANLRAQVEGLRSQIGGRRSTDLGT